MAKGSCRMFDLCKRRLFIKVYFGWYFKLLTVEFDFAGSLFLLTTLVSTFADCVESSHCYRNS
jgi:hypothetical protein